MKRTAVILSAFVFLFFAGMQTGEKPLPPVAIEVAVAPSSQDELQLLGRATPNTFTCHATVWKPEIENGRRYGYVGAELFVAPGRRETVTKKAEGFDFRFTVAISKERDRAATEVALMRGETILHLQKSDIVLKPAQRAIVPLR